MYNILCINTIFLNIFQKKILKQFSKYCSKTIFDPEDRNYPFGLNIEYSRSANDSTVSIGHACTCDPFDWQETNHLQPVEHVVNCSSGKCSPEFVAFLGLAHGNQRVGDRSANVSSHDDEDGWLDADNYKVQWTLDIGHWTLDIG